MGDGACSDYASPIPKNCGIIGGDNLSHNYYVKK